MKNILLPIVVSALICPVAFAGEGWETNMDSAKKKAEQEGKGLLIEFTGSDWCGPCMNLKKTVLVTEEFLSAAQKDFVLVELDFPRKALSEEQTAHNKKYAEMYSISGYPTVIFTDATGRPVSSFVGGRGLPEVLDQIKTAVEKKTIIANNLGKLKDAKGDDRYKLAGEIFDSLPLELINGFYGDVKDAVKDDANDVSGLKKLTLEKTQEDEQNAFMREASQKNRGDRDGFIAAIDTYLEKDDLLPNIRQKALSTQSSLYYSQQKMDESISKLADAIAADPDSEFAKRLATQKDYLEKNKDNIVLANAQTQAWAKFETSLDNEVKADPAAYVKACQGYLDENKDLVPQVRQMILQTMSMALIADDKVDEAMAKLQEAIDADSDSTNGNGEAIKQYMNMLKSDKKLAEQIKNSWKNRIPAAKIQTPQS